MIQIKDAKLYIKIGNQPEIDAESIAPGLEFLGDDENPSIANAYLSDSAKDGNSFNYATFQKNIINAEFCVHFGDYYEYKFAKANIFRKFMTKELIRIRTDAEPAIVKYVRAAPFEIKPISPGANDALFTIPFDNPSGYKYSLGYCDDIKDYQSELWQVGMNMPYVQQAPYQFVNPTNFRVWNASDITIDPYYQNHQLQLIMKHDGYGFSLINHTTGKEWSYTGKTTSSDTILLDGINTFKNGNIDNNNTDYGYLTLAPGWNEFSVAGIGDLDILFHFKFIYIG
ncbi:phage tail domain-containing protein [Liquorilactobacillus capillatus]|uniref:Siphovirus-type tail component RIFT-related domain-containing protein n=1 Tax=Liquorilactobacillus capillatus DSM 19910 TaxID=1423731 RepID=A0A0R1M3I6_9LACO|nr:phage tail domain-containing protein [Liquorilactobacillus capillatus]KRL02526.1 hypothetical protein FC81_GL000694 [Liquorilactobacillus capillatus DSM 19910]